MQRRQRPLQTDGELLPFETLVPPLPAGPALTSDRTSPLGASLKQLQFPLRTSGPRSTGSIWRRTSLTNRKLPWSPFATSQRHSGTFPSPSEL